MAGKNAGKDEEQWEGEWSQGFLRLLKEVEKEEREGRQNNHMEKLVR